MLILLTILYQEIKLGNLYSIRGIFALMLAMFCHSGIYLYSTKYCKNISILTFNALPSFCSGLFLLCISILIEHPIFQNFSKISILALIYLSYFSGIFGILAYFYLQSKVSAIHASIVFFIFPLVTLFLNYYIYGHTVTNFQFHLIIYFLCSILLALTPIRYIQIKNIIAYICKDFYY
nr:DMT family transporter [Buchnera aphidicola]